MERGTDQLTQKSRKIYFQVNIPNEEAKNVWARLLLDDRYDGI